MMKWAALVLLASVPASADPLVQAITRHEEGDVAALRAKLPDDSTRCALGVVYIFRDDLTRAALHLAGCEPARLAPGIAGWVRLAMQRLPDRLRMSELAELAVTSAPPGLAVTIDTVPGEIFSAAAPLWLPAGTHELRAGEAAAVVTVRARAPATAHLALPPAALRPRRDPRVAVMRANDCALHRKRYGISTCPMGMVSDDIEYVVPRTGVWQGSRLPDSIAAILQTAEEQ